MSGRWGFPENIPHLPETCNIWPSAKEPPVLSEMLRRAGRQFDGNPAELSPRKFVVLNI